MSSAQSHFFDLLRSRPVIAGLRDAGHLEVAIRLGAGIVFILGGDIFVLRESVRKARAQGAMILAHVDLIKGVGRDEAGVRFLARDLGVDGILTTRANLVGPARREGLLAVQRLFVLDSESLETGLPAVERAGPDAVEILPGVILPLIARRLRQSALPPLIAGGLIAEESQVEEILRSGAVGVSTSAQPLWRYRPDAARGSR